MVLVDSLSLNMPGAAFHTAVSRGTAHEVADVKADVAYVSQVCGSNVVPC